MCSGQATQTTVNFYELKFYFRRCARVFGVNLEVMVITQIGYTWNPGYIWVTRVTIKNNQNVSSLSKVPMEIMVDLQQTYHKLIDVIINNDINNFIVTLYFRILLE